MKKGTPINNNIAISKRYEKALQKLIDNMRNSTEKELNYLFNRKTAKTYVNDAKKEKNISTKAKLALAALFLKFQLMFRKKSKTLVQAMLEDVEKYASGAVRRSLKELTGESFNTSTISKLEKVKLQAITTENVSLIKSIPPQYFTQVTGDVMRAISTGNIDGLTESIVKHGKVSEKRAKMIALDQTNRAIQTISRQKMIDKGISKFQWIYTFRSKEPRPSHVKMNGNVYRLDSPPIINADSGGAPKRGYPGDLINCKCTMKPISEWEK